MIGQWGVLPYLSGFVCAYHIPTPGLSPIYAFITYSQICAIFVKWKEQK